MELNATQQNTNEYRISHKFDDKSNKSTSLFGEIRLFSYELLTEFASKNATRLMVKFMN